MPYLSYTPSSTLPGISNPTSDSTKHRQCVLTNCTTSLYLPSPTPLLTPPSSSVTFSFTPALLSWPALNIYTPPLPCNYSPLILPHSKHVPFSPTRAAPPPHSHLPCSLHTHFTLGHSSHTCCWVIWKRPGPSCLVTISCRQLQRLVPEAARITGLLRTICKGHLGVMR